MVYVCFDIGGTLVKHAVYNLDGQMQTSGDYQTPHDSKEHFYQKIVAQIKAYEAQYTIAGIGLSMPGFINPKTGRALTAGALYELYEENILEGIRAGLNQDYPMAIENDANCAALAEQMSGNAMGLENFLLITIGTGIGGAIVLNGQLYRGNTFRAGEFGQMHIDVAKSPYQTTHELAATSALVKAYKKHKQLADATYVDARQIITEIDSDAAVKSLFDQWTIYLAAVIFNASTFFNPEKILLGGGISANPALIPAIERQLGKDHNWEDMRCDLVACKYYNEAGLRGALGLIKQATEAKSRKEY